MIISVWQRGWQVELLKNVSIFQNMLVWGFSNVFTACTHLHGLHMLTHVIPAWCDGVPQSLLRSHRTAGFLSLQGLQVGASELWGLWILLLQEQTRGWSMVESIMCRWLKSSQHYVSLWVWNPAVSFCLLFVSLHTTFFLTAINI